MPWIRRRDKAPAPGEPPRTGARVTRVGSPSEAIRLVRVPDPVEPPAPDGHEAQVDRVEKVAAAVAPSLPTADESVIRALYLEHAGPLLGYTLHLTGGDRPWAEDVMQETLLRAWKHPEALDPARGSVRAWLCTVARNLVIDGSRARRARPQETGDAVLDSVPDRQAEDQFDRALMSWEVAEALGALTPDHRAVLLETYYRGCSVAEAAKVLGVPEGTVKSRTYYALRALRVALQERGLV